jgi:hypothetical protein
MHYCCISYNQYWGGPMGPNRGSARGRMRLQTSTRGGGFAGELAVIVVLC